MKKILLVAVATALMTTSTFAQKEKGKSVVTAGVGYSLVGGLFNAVYSGYTDVKTSAVPALNAMYDYALTDKFSIGAAVTYQGFTVKYQGVTNYDANTGDFTYGEVKNTWSRLNVGLRPLLHFGKSENLDMYTGLRIGYSTWSYKSNQYTNYPGYSEVNRVGGITFQGLFGMRYFFIPAVGINTEIAIGSPYLFSIGANFKF